MDVYEQLFKSIDTDSDGKITLEEFRIAATKLPEFSDVNIDYTLTSMFGSTDSDQNIQCLEALFTCDGNIFWSAKIDLPSFMESIELFLVLQSLPRCNQRQNSVQKECLRKLFRLITGNNEDSISKDQFQQLFTKIQALNVGKFDFTVVITKKGTEDQEDIEMADLINGIFYHMDKNEDGKLTVENVFQGLKFKLGLKLCHLSFAKHFIKFVDYPCGYIDDSSDDLSSTKLNGSSTESSTSGEYLAQITNIRALIQTRFFL